MDIQLLKIFLTIAEVSSLTEASRKLNTVQSNISVRLKILEDEVGQALFFRSKKGMILTEAGEKLMPMASELVQKTEDIKTEMRKDRSIGHITIGVPESFLRTYLQRPLAKWIDDHPGAKVNLKTGYSHEISELLENREIDFGVIISKDRPKQYHTMKEYPCEFVVITPKNVRDISKEALGDLQPMLSGDSCFFGRAVMGLVANLSLDSQGFSYIHSIESIVHCVSAGIGFSVLPKCLLDKHPMRSELSCHKYPGKARFSFYKVCLQSRKDTKLLREISKYI